MKKKLIVAAARTMAFAGPAFAQSIRTEAETGVKTLVVCQSI